MEEINIKVEVSGMQDQLTNSHACMHACMHVDHNYLICNL